LIPKHAFPADRDATNMYRTTPRDRLRIESTKKPQSLTEASLGNRWNQYAVDQSSRSYPNGLGPQELSPSPRIRWTPYHR
jgi:hypothetical protein